MVEGLNQDDLAALIGALREAVARRCRPCGPGDLVRTGRRSIEVFDLEGLRRGAVMHP